MWQPMPTPTLASVGRVGRAVVRAARAEERRAQRRAGQRAAGACSVERARGGPRPSRSATLRGSGARRARAITSASSSPSAGSSGRPSLVALADDARALGEAVERVAERGLEERAASPRRRGSRRGRAANSRTMLALERPEHPELEEADAAAAQRRVVEAEVAQRLAQLVVGLAGGDDAQPGVARRARHAVEPVQRGRTARASSQARAVQRALHLQRVGREQVGASGWWTYGPPSHSTSGMTGGRGRGRRSAVPAASATLVTIFSADPQAGRARQRDGVQAEVEDLLHVARVERRACRARRASPRSRWAASRTCSSGRRRRARARRPCGCGADEVAVAQRVGGAVDARGLAVPDADTPS